MSSDPKNPLEYDQHLDSALRPTRFSDYVGQEHIKENLKILLTAAKERSHPPEHLLFYGPPGLGKTTLAYLIAREMGAQVKSTSGPAIEKVGDLASILTNLSEGDVLFIDEAHRLNKMVEEILYPALESGTLNIIIGKGPGARTIQIDLPPFTLIAATTRASLISSPLRSRFGGGTYRLEFYTESELIEIIRRSAKILNIESDESALREIAQRSRQTPRIANQYLKRVRDFAQVKKLPISGSTAIEALSLLEIDPIGLSSLDRRILSCIIDSFNGGPVGLSTIARALSEEEATIEEINEPYLMQLGLLQRTNRGRVVTARAYDHLGYDIPQQGTLLS